MKKKGFTLVELMVTVLIASIVVLGIAGVMADSHRGYNKMFTRIHGDIVNDAYMTRIRFDKTCRKAMAGTADIDISLPSLTVFYYGSPNVNGGADAAPTHFAEFYLNGSDLVLDTGAIGSPPSTSETIARNVTELKFYDSASKSVQMVMTLSDADHSLTVTCGSLMHN